MVRHSTSVPVLGYPASSAVSVRITRATMWRPPPCPISSIIRPDQL